MTSLGIDVSKDSLALALWQQGQVVTVASVPNTPEGWAQLPTRVRAPGGAGATTSVAVVLEPTGGYELGGALWAHQHGWQVHRPNPRLVRDWAKGEGHRAKSDRLDAKVLARYGAKQQPPVWQPLLSHVSELEAWLRRRDDVTGLLQQERNRQQQITVRPGMHREVPASVERVIGVLEEELRQIEQAIADHLAQHPDLAQGRARLLTVPGLGQQNVLPVLVLLCRWQTLTAGQGESKGLVADAGLDPQPYESGTSVKKPAPISRMGERNVRRLLYMGALGATRGDNPARAFYQRLVGRGKAKKLALVAAARKILIWAWAVFQAGTVFDPAKLVA